MSQMPFSNSDGGIACRFADLGQGGFFGVQPVSGTGTESAGDADPVGVASGHQRRARGGANRLRHVEISETDTFFCDPIKMRCLVALGAEATKVAVGQVVRKNENDVGAFRGRYGKGGKCE